MSRRGARRNDDPDLMTGEEQDVLEPEESVGDDPDGAPRATAYVAADSRNAQGEDPASTWDARYANNDWPSNPDPLLVELAGHLEPGLALDLGCGTGRNAIWLASRGWSVTGVDASAVGLAAAADIATRRRVPLNLIKTNLLSYHPPEGKFALVVVANIHMLPDDSERLFAMATTALGKDGHLFVIGHHLDDLGRHGPPDPERLYTVERLRRELPSTL